MTQSKTQSSALAVGEAWCLVWTHTSGRPASQPLPGCLDTSWHWHRACDEPPKEGGLPTAGVRCA